MVSVDWLIPNLSKLSPQYSSTMLHTESVSTLVKCELALGISIYAVNSTRCQWVIVSESPYSVLNGYHYLAYLALYVSIGQLSPISQPHDCRLLHE